MPAKDIDGPKLFSNKSFDDERGYFAELFNKNKFEKDIGRKVDFVQDNQSFSKKGVIRGLHFQKNPFEQGKLIRVIQGEIYDVAVDVRPMSESFGLFKAVTLSSDLFNYFWIPGGFAHGFQVISDNALVQYKVTNFYNPASEVTLNYNDPDIGIKWPLNDLIISERDGRGLKIREYFVNE